MTRLDAVNIIISNIGQAPVTRIDTENPMVQMAVNVLAEVSETVQGEGWVFNTERNYPFPLDDRGEVRLPENILTLDNPEYSAGDLVIRNGKLYDKRGHTYTFKNDLELDVVWLFDFEDLPMAARNYIVTRAANLFAGRAVGSAEQVKFGEREEAASRAALIEYETQQGDYNVLQNRIGDTARTYMPFYSGHRI